MTTTENNLEIGDVYRPRHAFSNGFMTMVVIDKKENGLITVQRPFCYGRGQNYELSMETFSFWINPNFEVDIYK